MAVERFDRQHCTVGCAAHEFHHVDWVEAGQTATDGHLMEDKWAAVVAAAYQALHQFELVYMPRKKCG